MRQARIIVTFLLALCLVAAFPGCQDRRALTVLPTATRELSLAVGRDCPPGALAALTTFCDDVASISNGTLTAQLQHWNKPLAASPDLAFDLLENMRQVSPEFAAAAADFLFASREHMDSALGAPKVLSQLGATLGASNYQIQNASYCGQLYLLCGESDLRYALRENSADSVRLALRDIINAQTPALPFNQSADPESRAIYYADTDTLSHPIDGQTDFTLIDPGIRYRVGFLMINQDFFASLGERQQAAILEAAAFLKPACDDYYTGLDNALKASFPDSMQSKQRLRSTARSLQESLDFENAPFLGPFSQVIDNYDI